MLSRLIPRVSPILRSSLLARSNSTAVAIQRRPRDKVATDWENFKMPLAPYEGMGPLPPYQEWDPKCMRHYVFPEHWFEFLYPRTGATGPYALALGATAFLFSKEWYIYTPETWTTIALIGASYTILKMVGSDLREGMNEKVETYYDCIYRIKMSEIDRIEAEVEDIKTEKWRSGLQELYHDVKKSNLAMMLETEFLNRKATFANAVKRRLDYQVAIQQSDRDLVQAHMVKWIEEKVRKSITPESQKATLDVCIARLNAITAK